MLDALKTKMFLASFKLNKLSYRQIHANQEDVEIYFKSTGKSKVEVNGEKVQQKNGKLVVLVGKKVEAQITEVVKDLKENKETISIIGMSFKITKCYVDENGKMIAFCVKTEWRETLEWDEVSTLTQLKIFVQLVECMQSKGYILQEERFQNENFTHYSSELERNVADRVCEDIVEFLKLFDVKKGAIRSAGGCLIEYIHYVLTNGGNLKSNYSNFYLINNGALIRNNVPYDFRIMKMCYDYLEYGLMPSQISSILEQALLYPKKNWDLEAYIAVSKELSSRLAVIEQTETYTLYEGNIKIYKDMSLNFAKFLKSRIIYICSNEVMEKVQKVIKDFEGNIIGYVSECAVEENEKEEITNISSGFLSSEEIICRVLELRNYLEKVREYIIDAEVTLKLDMVSDNQFQIEDALVVHERRCSNPYKIKSIADLYKLAYTSNTSINKKLIGLFFKWYLQYLEEKYGKMHKKEEVMKKSEVRYLTPILAKEFVKYALGKPVNVNIDIRELDSMFAELPFDSAFYKGYDKRFCYDPRQVPFLFDYEVKQEYGIELEKGKTIELPNGERLTVFEHAKTIAKLKEKEAKNKYEISIAILSNEKINYVGISKVVYSEKIASNGMYKVVGYIQEPCKGNFLTDDFLLNCNNIEMYKIMGYLLSSFVGEYIPWQQIRMDENFEFYINLMDSNLKLRKVSKKEGNVINIFLEHLRAIGYNPSFLLDDSLTSCSSAKFLIKAITCDAFCEEHNLYYDSSQKVCPACAKTTLCLDISYIQENGIKILEDDIAVHYRLLEDLDNGNGEQEYNIKLYKELDKDKAYLESQVTKMVERPTIFGQDCFIATRKVIDENENFIGYCYEEPNSKEQAYSMDLTDTTKLNNLQRLKTLIQLMKQVDGYLDLGYGFTQNPFSHVFFNPNYKRQVQILNIEFLSKQGNLVDTIKWTFEYVYQTIINDENLNVSIWLYKLMLDHPVDFKSHKKTFKETLDKLVYKAKELTEYCPIHRLYYSNQNLCCPKCVDQTEIESFEKIVVSKESITERQEIGNGGESIIYLYEEKYVAKVFKEEAVDLKFKNIILAKAMKKQSVLEAINKQNRQYQYIHPRKLLIDRNTNAILGYIMEKVNGGRPLSDLKDKKVIEDLKFTRQDVIEILISVGKGIETLHKNGIYIGDLNGRNILFDNQKKVYFLDFDGMGFDEIQPMFCTDEYIDPISKKAQNITMKDDWYSYAVQAFHYLTYTHPFNGIYTVRENGEEVSLDIIDKMERRISLLGDHEIQVPAIACSWEWMSRELKNALLNIFESENRESILPYLVADYNRMYHANIQVEDDMKAIEEEPSVGLLQQNAEEQNAKMQLKQTIVNLVAEIVRQREVENVIRINSKFTATKFNPFEGHEVVLVFNEDAAICRRISNKIWRDYYLLLPIGGMLKKHRVAVPNKDVLFLENGKVAWAINGGYCWNTSINLTNGCTAGTVYEDTIEAIVNQNTLNLLIKETTGYSILQIEYMEDGKYKKQKIALPVEGEVNGFGAKFNSKFVIVTKSRLDEDTVFCNMQNLCTIHHAPSISTHYNVIYDEFSKKWLVVNNAKGGVIIHPNGTYDFIHIPENIDDFNVDTVCFENQKIYIPGQDRLHIIKTKNNQLTAKTMECQNMMTPESKLYNINKNGFNVITNNTFYEVHRG